MNTQQDHVQVEADVSKRQEIISKKIKSHMEIETNDFIDQYQENINNYLPGEYAAVAVDQLISTLIDYETK
jgi:hypothetical protein